MTMNGNNNKKNITHHETKNVNYKKFNINIIIIRKIIIEIIVLIIEIAVIIEIISYKRQV